jgi:hypothetical protein
MRFFSKQQQLQPHVQQTEHMKAMDARACEDHRSFEEQSHDLAQERRRLDALSRNTLARVVSTMKTDHGRRADHARALQFDSHAASEQSRKAMAELIRGAKEMHAARERDGHENEAFVRTSPAQAVSYGVARFREEALARDQSAREMERQFAAAAHTSAQAMATFVKRDFADSATRAAEAEQREAEVKAAAKRSLMTIDEAVAESARARRERDAEVDALRRSLGLQL